jgi:hypothetical protein
VSVDNHLVDETAFLEEVTAFIRTPVRIVRSQWFRCSLIDAYIRTGPKFADGEVIVCTTVSNVEVPADRRGKGVYRAFLKFICETSPHPVFIENVLSLAHHGIYLRRGFAPLKNHLGFVDAFIRPAELSAERL